MSRRAGRILAFGLTVVAGAALPAWAHDTTERVSVGPGGIQGDGDSFAAAISAHGRFVAFFSTATNLVPGDTNGFGDVFVRDRQMGTTERISIRSGGVEGNARGDEPAISADGRFIAFHSIATNLVPNDNNDAQDIFVRDRQTDKTRRVNLGPGGIQGDAISQSPAISPGGRFIAFASEATNLAPGDTNHTKDIFVRDRQTGTTRRVNLRSGSVQGNFISLDPAISANGRFVTFISEATNLVPGDTNDVPDVFVHDRQTDTTERVSLGPGGAQGNNSSDDAAISADGRFVAFYSFATNLVPGDTNDQPDVFVRDRQMGTTRRASLGPSGVQGNSDSVRPAISADGRFVVFNSIATNLVPGDTNGFGDVFVRVFAP